MRYILLAITAIIQGSVASANCWDEYASQPTGDFVVVAMRVASDVNSTPVGDTFDYLMGQTVSFDDPKTWLENQPFDSSHYVEALVPVVDIRDPNLSDLLLEPLEISGEEYCRIVSATQVVQNGSTIQTFLTVDQRVIVVPMANSALNVILEKPLEEAEAYRFQVFLKENGYYEGALSGMINQSTRNAIALYSESRGAAYRFADPVISGALLAGLNILNEE